MIASVGIDIVEIGRFKAALRRHEGRLLEKLFTPGEQRYCEDQANRLAHYTARFAAKEAVLKALGTGWSGGIRWTDVEVVRAKSGEVSVELEGAARKAADRRRIRKIHLNLSHSQAYAVAIAVAEQ